MEPLIFVLFMLCFCCMLSCSTSQHDLAPGQFIQYLRDNNYEETVRPNSGDEKPTDVLVRMFIADVSKLHINQMNYHITLFLQLSWIDRRLAHNSTKPIVLNQWEQVKLIWRPDLFFVNSEETDVDEIIVPNMRLTIQPDGSVLHFLRFGTKMKCPMNLRRFPFDTQVCQVVLESFSTPDSEMRLLWQEDLFGGGVVIQYMPKTDEYEIVSNATGSTTFQYPDGNISVSYTNLYFNLTMERSRGQYLLQIYIPSAFIVSISWVSFWLDAGSIQGRVGLCLTTLLTLSTQASGHASRLPRVGYVKALDVWMLVCMLFLIAALLVSSFSNSSKTQALRLERIGREYGRMPFGTIHFKRSSRRSRRRQSFRGVELSEEALKLHRRSALIDGISKMVFPTVFLLFSVCYFIVYYD